MFILYYFHMHKLYFKYGAMGSSKSAQALMCRFNYIQKGFNVLTIKPSLDTRSEMLSSRIGLSAPCVNFLPTQNLTELFEKENAKKKIDIIIVDECQFMTKAQVEQLRELTEFVPILCYGLLTNFKTELFEGSKRLIELAESVQEIKSVCKCGRKAIVNAKIRNRKIVLDGPEIEIGAEDKYESFCYTCYSKLKKDAK